EAAAQRTVAEHGDDLEIGFAVDVARGGHPERGGDRRGGVTGAEGVVLALGALEKAGDPSFLAQRLHARVAPREQLVRIALMADVPDELVARRLKGRVERDRQLDHSQPRADVAPRAGADVDEARPNLLGERTKLV